MRPAGRTDSRLLYRDDEPRIEIVAPCPRWSFDSDGTLFKLAAASKTDLVFLDPDSGIEIPSKPVGHKNSSKYVTWCEIQQLWESGCSLLIYQHFPRKRRHAFAASMTSELRRRTGTSLVEAFRTARVLFLLAAQDRHHLNPAFSNSSCA